MKIWVMEVAALQGGGSSPGADVPSGVTALGAGVAGSVPCRQGSSSCPAGLRR